MVIAPSCTSVAPYQITATMPPNSTNTTNEINKPRNTAARNAVFTTSVRLLLYLRISNHSLVNDFTACTACKVSSTITLLAANWSCVSLDNLRIYLPKNRAAIIRMGKVASIKPVSFGAMKAITAVPISSVAICRRNSASVTEKVFCSSDTSEVMRLMSSPVRWRS